MDRLLLVIDVSNESNQNQNRRLDFNYSNKVHYLSHQGQSVQPPKWGDFQQLMPCEG